MGKGIDWNRLWKLPEDLRKRVVYEKNPLTKREGDLSYYIAIALCRLPTHREMRAIAKQIHPSTQYKPFNRAITAYLNSTEEVKRKVLDGKIHIMDLLKGESKYLSEEDRKNIVRYNNAKELNDKLKLFYKDLKFFLEGTPEDREYLRKFLKPEKIHYIASVLSCIRNEELLQTLIKNEGIKEWDEL